MLWRKQKLAPHDFTKGLFADDAFMFDVAINPSNVLPTCRMRFKASGRYLTSKPANTKPMVVARGMNFWLIRSTPSIDSVFGIRSRKRQVEHDGIRNCLNQTRDGFSGRSMTMTIWMFGGSDVSDGNGYATAFCIGGATRANDCPPARTSSLPPTHAAALANGDR